MARPSAIDGLPAPIRTAVDERIRKGDTVRSIVLWLETQGITMTDRKVNIYASRLKTEIKNSRLAAENTIALAQVAESSGIRIDLLTLAQDYLAQAMRDAGAKHFSGMRPADMLAAVSRLTAVDVQVNRLKADLKAKLDEQIKLLEGEPGLSSEMLVQIRQRVYGIFD